MSFSLTFFSFSLEYSAADEEEDENAGVGLRAAGRRLSGGLIRGAQILRQNSGMSI